MRGNDYNYWAESILIRLIILPLLSFAAGAAVAAALTGCALTQAHPTPRHTLRTAADAYQCAVEVAADYRQAGVVDDRRWVEIERHRRRARAALDAWREAVLRAEATRAPAALYWEALRAFEDAILRARAQKGGTDGSDS